jgi:hypothetical protein
MGATSAKRALNWFSFQVGAQSGEERRDSDSINFAHFRTNSSELGSRFRPKADSSCRSP